MHKGLSACMTKIVIISYDDLQVFCDYNMTDWKWKKILASPKYHHHTRIHNTRIRSWLLFSMPRRGCPLFELIYDSSPVSQWFQTRVSCCISVAQWGCFAEVSLFREDTQIFGSQVLQESKIAETQFVVGIAFSFTLAWFLQITSARYCKLHGLIWWLWRTRQQM